MSIVLNIDQLKAKCEKNGYKYAAIYEGHFATEPDKQPFESWSSPTVEHFLKNLEEFAAMYPGNFTGLFRTSKDTAKRHLVKCSFANVEIISSSNISYKTGSELNIQELTVQITERVRAEMQKEREAEQLKQELQEKTQELEKMQSSGGKLVYALEHLLLRAIAPAAKQTRTTQLQGHPEHEYTEDEMNELETAFSDLLEVFGYDTIINLSVKVKDPGNAHILPIVRNFANS